MSTEMNEEKYLKILRESAVQRYGEDRAKLLESAIREAARSLSSIAEFPLALEAEPAFYTK